MNLNSNIYIKPSYWSQILNGIIFLIIILMIIMNFNKIMKMDLYQKMIILLLLGIYIGIHGLMHLGLEKTYDYNPLEQIL